MENFLAHKFSTIFLKKIQKVVMILIRKGHITKQQIIWIKHFICFFSINYYIFNAFWPWSSWDSWWWYFAQDLAISVSCSYDRDQPFLFSFVLDFDLGSQRKGQRYRWKFHPVFFSSRGVLVCSWYCPVVGGREVLVELECACNAAVEAFSRPPGVHNDIVMP